ncbi:MAG: glutaredoxin domain-containing protein [Anaerolineales bacterium]|jgi:glutaredoxin
MDDSNIIIYGVNWCWDSRRARRFFDKNKIPYTFINIDKDKQGEQFVLDANDGLRSVPTIVFNDGSILVEPTTSELIIKINIIPSDR